MELSGTATKALRSLDEAVKAGYSLDEIAKEPELRELQADSGCRDGGWLRQADP